MLRARRQRGVLRRFVQSSFEFGNAAVLRSNMRQQHPNDGLRLRRLTCDQFIRDLIQRHAQDVAEIGRCAKSSFSSPGA
jgi:hypothetical protein